VGPQAYKETLFGLMGLKTSFFLDKELVSWRLLIKFANWYWIHFV